MRKVSFASFLIATACADSASPEFGEPPIETRKFDGGPEMSGVVPGKGLAAIMLDCKVSELSMWYADMFDLVGPQEFLVMEFRGLMTVESAQCVHDQLQKFGVTDLPDMTTGAGSESETTG